MTAERPFVFLCHPHTRADYAAQLAQYLGERNVRVWYDKHMAPGRVWRKELADRLHECGAVVVLVAEGTAGQPWIEREIKRAKTLRKRIFPLMLPDGTKLDSLESLQYSKTKDGWPEPSWIREVHDHLYPVPSDPTNPALGTAEAPPRPGRRAVAVAAVAGILGAGALGWAAGRHDSGHAADGPAPPSATPGGCDGRAAHIDKISTLTPGHTGRQPELTVTVCVPAPRSHEYWLMNYTEDGANRTFYAKVKIDGTAGTRPYVAVLTAAAEVGSRRKWVVAAVPTDRSAEVNGWADADNAPLAPSGAAPEGVRLVSNEEPSVL